MDRKYKPSIYNILISRENTDYLWNTLTGAFIKLDGEAKDYISEGKLSPKDKWFETLEKNGCVVADTYNELGKILYDEKSVMLNRKPRAIHYTIAPGLGCNYRCEYCFERGNNDASKMSSEVMNNICTYIENEAKNNQNLRHVGITWFGGEPLIYLDVIETLSKSFIQICDENDIGYSASVVTNGRFLNDENLETLIRCKVKSVQLSMDGDKEQYVRQKGANSGDYDEVIRNICDNYDKLPITIRINVRNDEESFDSANRLVRYLLEERGLDGKVKVYLAHIRDYESVKASEEMLEHSKFLKLQGDFIKQFGSTGKYLKESLDYIPPKRRPTTCLTVCRSNLCIGPKGELYRCEHFFGQEKHIVGTVQDGFFYSNDDVEYLQFRHPKKCEECDVFPVCLGGCMNDAKNGDIILSCEELRERFIDFLFLENSN